MTDLDTTRPTAEVGVLSVAQALGTYVGHRHYPYRGCAPDPERPGLAAGADIPLTSWDTPDIDGGEPHDERRTREAAALAVCASCPVLTVCRTWSLAATDADTLPYGVSGGLTALDRHRLVIESRMASGADPQAEGARYGPQVVRAASTPQKRAVLRALAAHTRPEDVARAAGLDVRTANWQRSKLCGLFRLDRDRATRLDLLHAAQEAGLLDDVLLADDDGSVLAAPALESPSGPRLTVPTRTGEATQATQPANPRPTSVAESAVAAQNTPSRGRPSPVRVRLPARTRFTAIPGQLCLDDLTPPAAPARRALRLVHAAPTPVPALESAA